ncbi:MAG: DUF4410 domain-containing protein [Pseudomonadota bacterium]
MKKYHFGLPLAMAIVLTLAIIGCAGSPQTAGPGQMPGVERIDGATTELVKQEKPVQGAGTYANISLGSFEASDEYTQDYKDDLTRFRVALIGNLQSKKKFARVIDGSDASSPHKTVKVTGKIISMRITSTSARIWGGVFAGSSHMDIYVKLTDAATGKVIKEKVIASYNNAWGASYSSGHSDSSMPADMGEIISEYLCAVIPTK